MPDQNERKDLVEKSAHLVSWFFAGVGLIYGCGFLIVYTFFKQLGIETVVITEPRYVHVGFLFFMACIVIVAPMFWLVWPLRDKNLLFEAYIQDCLLGRNKKKRKDLFLAPLKRFFFPIWSIDPTHGIHTGLPVIISMILILWSFIILTIFAPINFGQHHPRLAIFNFLIPMLILALGLMGDWFKGGALDLLEHKRLQKFRFGLRAWWIFMGLFYLYLFATTSIFDGYLFWLTVAFFLPPIVFILFVLFSFFCRTNGGDNAVSEPAKITICHWTIYSIQWVAVIWQCWTFIWTIRRNALNLSLLDVLLGGGGSGNSLTHFIFPRGAIYFILLIALIGFFNIRNVIRYKQITDEVHRRAMLVSIAIITIPLFYISIIAFAITIYPFIPYEKGGGDYSDELPVYVTFNTNSVNLAGLSMKLSEKLVTANESGQLIILDENSTFVYFAFKNQFTGQQNCAIGTNKPTVYEVSREAVASIVQRP